MGKGFLEGVLKGAKKVDQDFVWGRRENLEVLSEEAKKSKLLSLGTRKQLLVDYRNRQQVRVVRIESLMGPATSFDEPPAAISEKLDLSLEELIQRNGPTSTEGTPLTERSRTYRPARFTTTNNRREGVPGGAGVRTPPHHDPNRLVSLRGPNSIRKRRGGAPPPPQQADTASSHIAAYQPRIRNNNTSGGPGGTPHPQQQRLQPSDAALLATEVTRQDNGDVVVRLKQTDIIVVKGASGDLVSRHDSDLCHTHALFPLPYWQILNSGGYRTFLTKTVLNQALQPVGLWVSLRHTCVRAHTKFALSSHYRLMTSQLRPLSEIWRRHRKWSGKLVTADPIWLHLWTAW